jgi:hypothetical protein
MQREKLKLIVRNLKSLIEILESEVYSEPEAYINRTEITDYDEVFIDDDDGYQD